jgi:hypothetical protein
MEVLHNHIRKGDIEGITSDERVMLARIHADDLSVANPSLKESIVAYGNAFFKMLSDQAVKAIRDKLDESKDPALLDDALLVFAQCVRANKRVHAESISTVLRMQVSQIFVEKMLVSQKPSFPSARKLDRYVKAYVERATAQVDDADSRLKLQNHFDGLWMLFTERFKDLAWEGVFTHHRWEYGVLVSFKLYRGVMQKICPNEDDLLEILIDKKLE